MICWAVTGPMGAGKTSFSKALVHWGAVLIDADQLGHEVLKNQVVIDKLVTLFGAEILENEAISRPRLGHKVFNDSQALVDLNTITHPEICVLAQQKIESLAQEKRHTLAVFEAAVYFLFPDPPHCDLVITVTTSEAVRTRRLMASRGLSLAETESRLKSQRSLEKYWETADILVHNDGSVEELKKEATRLMFEYGLLAGGDDPRRELTS